MPADKMSEKDFIKIFDQVANKTENFSKLDPNILAENPKIIKVFRMLHGMGLVEFAKLLKKNYNTISQYELGGINKTRLLEAQRMTTIIIEDMPLNSSREQAILNFRKFKEMSIGGAVQGLLRAEKADMTKGEKKIEKLLKKHEIKFEVHKTLNTGIGPLNFDFLVDNKILIECTESDSKQKAESLGFRALKVKQTHKHLKTVVIIPQNVTNGVKRRLADFDHIIFSNRLDRLETLLK